MERWQAGLSEKAAIEAEAKSAALEAAKADLETHVLERAANKEAKMGRNREQEQVHTRVYTRHHFYVFCAQEGNQEYLQRFFQ